MSWPAAALRAAVLGAMLSPVAGIVLPGAALAGPAAVAPAGTPAVARAGTSAAAPAAPPAAPTTSRPGDDTADPTRPVRIDLTVLEPRALTPGSTITLSGTLTNTGNQPVSDLSVRLQRGRPLTTRSELSASARDSDPATTVAAAFQLLPGRLGSGDSVPFTYTVSEADLQIAGDGVYPALLNLNGTVGGEARQRVGEVATFLVQQPSSPLARTTVGWVWPIVAVTHRLPSGAFADDDLAREVAPGGRLDRALAVVERLPRAPAAPGSPAAPQVPVTLAVDPALIEELGVMAAGPYRVQGQGTGKGTEAARDFLGRMRAVAGSVEVAALPYGDVDAESLVPAGLRDVVASALPAGRPDQGDAGGPAVRILSGALGVQPRTDLGWAPGGTLHAETLATLRAGGIAELIVPGSALAGGQAALGLTGRRATAHTAVPLPSGPMNALVGDTVLGDLVGSAGRGTGGRLAEQRYLAELAVLALQSPGDPVLGQSVLVAPPREVDVDPAEVAAMIADTTAMPWLRAASLAQLATGPASDAGTLAGPSASAALDSAGLSDLAAAVAARNNVVGALVDPGDLGPYDAAIARAAAVSWRGHPRQFRDAAAAVRDEFGRLRERVTLLVPADGTYSLASSNAPLVLTVRNDLPFPVRVRLQLRTRGNVGLTVGDIGVQQLPPESRTTLQVPTQVRQSGRFVVTAALTTPDGGALGDRVQFQVRSTAYGPISLVITIGAAGLLALLFLRRLVRFLLRRRRGLPGAGTAVPEPTAEGAVAPPPARSPV